MRYLLDTNIVSELNKRTPNAGVLRWFEAAEDTDLFLSVVTVGEIRKGNEQVRRRNHPGDEQYADRLEQAPEGEAGVLSVQYRSTGTGPSVTSRARPGRRRSTARAGSPGSPSGACCTP